MLSGPQSYMESNCAANWYSFQCNLQCRIQLQTGVEFCWLTQHLRKEICSTLLCTIYCLNYFAKMLSGPQSYMESNCASNWYSFQCNLQCRIQLQTGVEFNVEWLNYCSTLLCRTVGHSNMLSNLVLDNTLCMLEWNKSTFGRCCSHSTKFYASPTILHCKFALQNSIV